MIYGFAQGDYAFMDSDVFTFWSGGDEDPVSARNYAEVVFSYDDTEHTVENVLDELEYFFRHADGYNLEDNVAIAVDTVAVWPFVVRKRLVMIDKHYDTDSNKWVEVPYILPPFVVVDDTDCD